MTKIVKIGVSFILTIIVIISCQNDRGSSLLSYPDFFPEPRYQFTKNVLSKEGFELGKALFHDPILSKDNSISCETCHAQVHAFADHNVSFSTGVEGRRGNRNSPSIVNAIWHTSFMWDGGINHIEIMPFGPIENHVEMDESLENIIAKLENSPYYKAAFKKVFNEDKINSQQIFFALTQYMGMLISDDSKYDKYRKGLVNFDSEELEGYLIFKNKCSGCHVEPLFTDYSFRHTGLEDLMNDIGRGRITLNESDNYKFKVPTLRNVMLTYPYMHDGRFMTIDEVLDHYSSGVMDHPNLDPALRQNGKLGIELSDDDKKALKKFLYTLNDYSFISNKLFSQ